MTDRIEGVRLSPQQRRLWHAQRLQETLLAVRLEADLRGPLDREALLAALGRAVARHDALRTAFRLIPGMRTPVQDVGEESRLDVRLEPAGPDRHVLTLTLPALCGDLRTLRLLLRDAAGEGAEEPLPPLQYWQYSEWLNDLLEEASLEDQAWWQDRLPVDPAPALPQGAAESLDLDPAVLAAVRRSAAANGVSVEVFLLAAWTVLLQRHADGPVAVGVSVDGRELEDLAGTLGAFARTLPMRLPWRDDASFPSLLAETSEALAEKIEHQRFFTLDVSFLAAFEYREPFPPLRIAGAVLTLRREQAPGAETFGPALVCSESVDSLTLSGPAPLLSRLAILLAGAAGSDGPVGDLEILPAAERAYLLGLNPPSAAPVDFCVHHRIRERPATALAFGSRQLSYAEMLDHARSLSARLRAAGVGPEARVGLCTELGPAALVAMLGIWGAGGAYVPVDPQGPAERRAFFLADSGARVVVTQPSLLPSLSGLPQARIAVDLDSPPEPHTPVEDGVVPGNLAYVLYTSGSTGTPKGVAVEHRQLAGYLSWVDRVLFGDRVRSCPLLTPLTFDASLKQALPPLLQGETVWGPEAGPEGAALDPPALLAELAHRRRVGINCTPTLWRAVLDEIERGGSAADLSGVTRIFLGGERLPPELFARTSLTLPGAEVRNVYGPTEATANAAAARLASGGPVVLGRPIDGTRIHLLDRRGNLVPPGVAGEICIGGSGVARGYLGLPGRTAERFVPDPFSPGGGERLYRTGDLGRLTPKGDLEYLGRTDHQVKIRGFRIELGEIEACLERRPEVREAAVVAQDDGSAVRLAAFVVPERGAVSAAELRSSLREALPEYMVPSAFVVLDRLPRLSSGKVDRAALPGPGLSALASERPFVAPRTPTEQRLADIWARVLGRESVSVEDNFFELGGHSIQSIQISHRAIAAGLPITPRDLLHHPTIAELAALADATGAATSVPPTEAGDADWEEGSL